MTEVLVLVIAALSVVFVMMAIKYSALKSSVPDLAQQQYQAWVATERQIIQFQEREAAQREANTSLQQWKQTNEVSIRQDAIQRSHSVTLGKVTEHLVPYLPSFVFNPKDARFIGSPVDMLVFDGLDEGDLREIIFIEVKTGPSAALSKRERQIREAVRAGRVRWQELRVDRSCNTKEESGRLF